jgi:catechol 2,3-dioxygenase
LGTGGEGVFLKLDSRGVTAPAAQGAVGLFHVAFRFPSRAALGDALARLAAAGYEVGAGDHLVSEALYIDDPDGNGVELYRDRPQEEWPAPRDGMIVPMATLPVDLESVLQEGSGRSAVGRGAPDGTGIGHVHLQVSNIDDTTDFYASGVGLDLIARLGNQAAFLSSNGYHHHIGANTWRSRNAGAPASNRAGLARAAFAVTDAGELESTRARLAVRGPEPGGEEGSSMIVSDPDGIELHFLLG